MEIPRQPIREVTDSKNSDVVAQNTPKLWACYRRSMNRAEYLMKCGYPRQAAKIDALNRAMFQTASMGGKALDAIRDMGVGSKAPAVAVGIQQPRTNDGVPHL